MDNTERFQYFIGKIISDKAVWLLKAYDGMYAMVEDDQNQTYLPVWPEEQYVKDFATDDWEDYKPEKMGLPEFLDWLQELKTDQILIGVFPNIQMQSLALDPLELKKYILQKTQ